MPLSRGSSIALCFYSLFRIYRYPLPIVSSPPTRGWSRVLWLLRSRSRETSGHETFSVRLQSRSLYNGRAPEDKLYSFSNPSRAVRGWFVLEMFIWKYRTSLAKYLRLRTYTLYRSKFTKDLSRGFRESRRDFFVFSIVYLYQRAAECFTIFLVCYIFFRTRCYSFLLQRMSRWINIKLRSVWFRKETR